MFKTGVITDEISQDFHLALEMAVRHGLDGVEIRSVWEKGPHELTEEDIDVIRRCTQSAGIAVPAVSAPFYKCSLDEPEEIRNHLNILERCIHLAHRLDARFIRGFTFWKSGRLEDRLEEILSHFETPVRRMEQEGLTLVLESDPSVSATNAAGLVRVLRGIRSDRVRALWDPGNDIHDPDREKPFPDGYAAIRPLMSHMHLKDAIRMPDGRIVGVPIGEGDVNWKGQMDALIADGYEGYLMLETHYRPAREIDASLMALPKGAAFSLHGDIATEECLRKWKALLPK